MSPATSGGAPRISVVVAARDVPATAGAAMASIAQQSHASDIELIIADGSDDSRLTALAEPFSPARCIAIPKGTLPELKGAAIRAATGAFVAILDPFDTAEAWVGRGPSVGFRRSGHLGGRRPRTSRMVRAARATWLHTCSSMAPFIPRSLRGIRRETCPGTTSPIGARCFSKRAAISSPLRASSSRSSTTPSGRRGAD